MPVHDLQFENVHAYGVQKEPLLLKYCQSFRFRVCSYSGGRENDIKNCEMISFNGKDLAE
jgi:hypothetical protein